MNSILQANHCLWRISPQGPTGKHFGRALCLHPGRALRGSSAHFQPSASIWTGVSGWSEAVPAARGVLSGWIRITAALHHAHPRGAAPTRCSAEHLLLPPRRRGPAQGRCFPGLNRTGQISHLFMTEHFSAVREIAV